MVEDIQGDHAGCRQGLCRRDKKGLKGGIEMNSQSMCKGAASNRAQPRKAACLHNQAHMKCLLYVWPGHDVRCLVGYGICLGDHSPAALLLVCRPPGGWNRQSRGRVW